MWHDLKNLKRSCVKEHNGWVCTVQNNISSFWLFGSLYFIISGKVQERVGFCHVTFLAVKSQNKFNNYVIFLKLKLFNFDTCGNEFHLRKKWNFEIDTFN